MNIVIVGAGNVGMTLAKTLAADMHNVTVIERDTDAADKAEQRDVTVVRGNGARPAVLRSAGIAEGCGIDALIACTNQDETNLMACWLAKRSGVKRVYARVKSIEFTDTPDWTRDLGIDDVAAPDRSLSREIASLLTFNAALHSAELLDGVAGSFAFRVEANSPICGLTLRELGAKYPDFGALIAYVERGNDGFIPSGEWTAQADDLCFVVSLRERVKKIQKVFSRTADKRLSKVVIIGGGKLGTNLARRLSQAWPPVSVYMIEKDPARADWYARTLPKVKMTVGDGMDKDLLLDVGLDNADGVVASTGNDEVNVVIASLAHVLGCSKTVAIVRNPIYDNLEDHLPVDVLLNPNNTLASTFLRYVRYPSSAKVMTFIDRIDAEMVDIPITAGQPAVGKKIYELGLPKGTLIAVIKRGGKHIIPYGGETVLENDVVSLFAKSEDMPTAMKFFGAR